MDAHVRTGVAGRLTGRTRRTAVPVALLLALAACSGGGGVEDQEAPAGATGEETEGADATEESTGPTEAPTGDAGGGEDGTVTVGETSLGDVLVDVDGMTLYMYDPDAQGPSTCYDDCAVAWPPLVADGEPVAGDGVDDALLGTAERTDGTMQVTYDGWPLYYFALDAVAGDVVGQAKGGVWWVLGADGAPVRG